jgi:hypothetical protein
MTKTIYNYDPTTGVFLSQGEADQSPLESDVFLIPANATAIAPPSVTANQISVFQNGKWSVVSDFRGTTYWLPDGTSHVQTQVGDLPKGASFSAPPPSLAQAQQAQLAIVGAACAAAITGGFQSSALGKAYTYPSTQNDQANLNANVVSSLLPGLPANWTTLQICGDANGKWGYMPHTAAQIQQVGIDGKAAILGCLTKNAGLQAQIAAATTVAAVQAINW